MRRREALSYLAASAGLLSAATMVRTKTLTRKIPSSGEDINSIGVGTWQTFDVDASDQKNELRNVLRTMVSRGSTVIDSSPMYGKSEAVVGELSLAENVNSRLFIATKVWTNGLNEGKAQMADSFRLLKRSTVLMQIHNLLDWQTHLKTLREMKERGRIRYIGLTHYLDSTHEKIEEIIRNNPVDFIQVNYSITDRHAERRLLPAAADLGVAVIINRPFQEGALFSQVAGKALPDFARDFDCSSWGQFFLKFILSNPNVTCVIPGTSKVKHLIDNLGAGEGRLPTLSEREKMAQLFA